MPESIYRDEEDLGSALIARTSQRGSAEETSEVWLLTAVVNPGHEQTSRRRSVITLGVILLLIGFLANISILWQIGVALLVIGLVLAVLGGTGRRVGGRAHWF